MPDIIDGNIDGLSDLANEIRRAERALSQTRRVTSDEADALLREARRRAPVESGHLRGAHRVNTSEHRAVLDAPTDYTNRQHFRQQTGAAREWLYDALDARVDDIVDAHLEHAENSLDQLGGRY